MCFLYAHVVGSTDLHNAERRKYEYSNRCQQCGAALTANTHVAAHVVAYPCGNGLCGFLTLRTTCRACNSSHQSGKKSKKRSWFCGFARRQPRRLSSCTLYPICHGPMDVSSHVEQPVALNGR